MVKTKRAKMMKLPREVILDDIAPHLSARDISSFSSVNSTIRKLLSPKIYSVEYWGKKIYEDLGEPIPDISPFSNEDWIDIRSEQSEETVMKKPLITRYNNKSKKHFGEGGDFCELLLKLKDWENPQNKIPAGGKELFQIYSVHYWGRRIYERYLCFDYAVRYLGSSMTKMPREHFDYVIGMTVAYAKNEREALIKLLDSSEGFPTPEEQLRKFDPRKSIKGDLKFLLNKDVVSQVYDLYSYFYDKEVTEDKDYQKLIHSPLVEMLEREKDEYFGGIEDKDNYFPGGVVEKFKNNWIAIKKEKGDINLKDFLETDEDGDTDLWFLSEQFNPDELIATEKISAKYVSQSHAKMKKRKSSRKKKRKSSRKKKQKSSRKKIIRDTE